MDPALRAGFDTLPEAVRRIVEYHVGWRDEDGNPTRRTGGKVIRPTLTLLMAQAVGGEPRTALPGAVAVELVHDFSLLHDDVMDGDRMRRHHPTVWAAFGIGPAILAGDALVTLAFATLAASAAERAQEATSILNAAVQALIDGQLADLSFEDRGEVTLDECYAMVKGKTGALLGCACALGALLGDGDGEQVKHARRFGEQLGLAFQLVDDILGIWGDPAVTGKAIHSDISARKKSLPVVAALGSGTPAGAELALLYGRDQTLSAQDVAAAAALVSESGGRAWTENEAQQQLVGALASLHAARVAGRAAAELEMLARSVTTRDH